MRALTREFGGEDGCAIAVAKFRFLTMLDPIDHSLKETERVPGYVRYCDDLLLFDDDKSRLHELRGLLKAQLAGLRLRLHPKKSVVMPVRYGVPFLGYRVLPHTVLLDKRNVYRFRRRMRQVQAAFARGEMNAKDVRTRDVRTRIMSWLGHVSHTNSGKLVEQTLDRLVFVRPTPDEADQDAAVIS